MKNLFLSLLMGLVMLGGISCNKDKKKGEVKDTSKAEESSIKIGYVYAMANSPLIIADKKQLFTKQGIKVVTRKYTSGPVLFKGLVTKNLDIAYVGFPPTYHWHAKGLPVTVIAKVNYGQHVILVKEKSGINKLEDLKNKKIAGVKKGSGTDVLLRGYVLQELAKLDLKDVRVKHLKSAVMGAALDSGSVDAAFTWEPFTSQYLLRTGYKTIFNLLDKVPKYPWYVIVVRNEFLKKNRDKVIKVLKAHQEAISILNSDPEGANRIIANVFKISPIKVEGKEISSAEIVKEARKRVGFQAQFVEADMKFFADLMKYSKSLGFLKKNMKPEDLVDRSLLKEAGIK